MSLPIFHMIQGAPDPVAPFSHAVEADGWVFVTGQMPFTGISSTSPYPEGIEAQTRQVMENLKRVLAGCGLGLEHVVAARLEIRGRSPNSFGYASSELGLRPRISYRISYRPESWPMSRSRMRGSYGLATWCSKPAASACCRSSSPARPVTAISAGRALP